MNISMWKRASAWGLAFAMVLSMTACGNNSKKKGSDSSGVDYGDIKNMVFSGEEFDMSDIKGDPGSFAVAGDKVYFVTVEWPEYDALGDEEVTDSAETEADAAEAENDGAEIEADEAEAENDSAETEADEAEAENDSAETEADEAEAENDGAETEADEAEAENDSAETEADATESEGDAGSSEDAVDYEDIQATTRIYTMNLDCTDVAELCEPKLENNEYINNLLVANDDSIRLFVSSWDEKTGRQSYFITTLDGSGNIVDHQNITDSLELGEDSYISKVIIDDKNQIIIMVEQKVIILSSDYKKLGEITSDNNSWLEGAAKTLDGSIICGESGEDGTAARIVDVDNRKLGEKIKLGISYFNSSDALMSGSGDYDFYYKDDKGVYGYSLKDKKVSKVMDYVASEIDSNNSYGIIPLSGDTMIGTGWNEETNRSTFTLYTKVDPSEVKDKTTITCGSLWGLDDSIRSAAIKFNKENDKYRIEFVDYGDFDNMEEANQKINAEFAAGNIPDIIDLNNLPYEQYVAKGILEDLTPYFEKDEAVSLDDIIPSVRNAMEIDGKIYYLSPSFSVSTLIASKKDVGDKTGWTFDELKALLDEKGEGVRPFYSENKKDTMYTFLYTSLDDYIDWTTGKCRFDSDDFKSILEIAGRGSDQEMDYSEDAESQVDLIKSGKVLFVDGGWLDTESLQMFRKMYNTDTSLIGYPCEDKQGSYFTFTNQLGLYSKSNVKDGAWEFIKTLMTKDYQAGGGNMWYNPTNKEAFEMFMKTKTATEAYKDEYGNEITPVDSTWGWDDLEVKIGPMSAEDEKVYRDLINNTTKVQSSNEAVMNIITEEAANYFNGQKSLDETADIIQNRVTTYVNENR